MSHAWADNTVKARKSQWKKYLVFCADRLLVGLPADTLTVARFLTYLARTLKYSTIDNYLSSVIVLHKYHGHDGGFRETFYIKLVLKGLRRILGDTPRQMIALSPEQLQLMSLYVDDRDGYMSACWAAIILCFRSLLRKSNVLPTSKALDPHIIRRRDVRFYTWGLVLNVYSTKTIQFRERKLEIPIFTVESSPLCAVTLLKRHWDRFPATPDSPLFMKPAKDGTGALMYSNVLDALKRLVKKIGLDSSNTGLHSLRRSGATFLCRIGVPLSDIKCVGDWRSLAVLEYLVTPLEKKLSIENTVMESLKKI